MRNDTTMRIVRTTLLGLAGLGAAGWLSASLMAGTPYAHIMAPVTASPMSARSVK